MKAIAVFKFQCQSPKSEQYFFCLKNTFKFVGS